MFFFGRKRKEREAEQVAELHAIRKQNIERLNDAADTIEKYSIERLIKEGKLGRTEMIFFSTGGQDRINGNKQK